MRPGVIVMAAVFVSVVLLTAGCGGRGGVGGPGKGVDLKYGISDQGQLTYRSVTESVQDMNVHGMEMRVTSNKRLVYSVLQKEREGEDLLLLVTVDSLSADTVSPQGSISADVDGVLGESFEMLLSPVGHEIDVSGAEALEYEMGMAGTRNLAADFQAVFPDLAGRRVMVGDTWTTADTLNIEEGDSEVIIMATAVNTLEGYETVGGLECVRVSAAVTGTLKGGGMQGGAKMVFDGTFEGNETWHFAYKEGIYVKGVSESNILNTVSLSGPQELEIPVTQTMKQKITLLR